MNASALQRRYVWLALLDAGVWAAWSTVAGYTAHRLPAARLARDGWLLRLRRRPERVARRYERVLRIKRWKSLLPEAGDLFKGGFSKRRLAHRDRPYLHRFVIETRRAELTHWAVMALGPSFFLWNPWWLGLAMLGYGLVANVPCLVTQRYNRARLLRMLGRGWARAERRPAGTVGLLQSRGKGER
jgi:glycosyl-4,4'-diaponeurosporenoate acyltransferase